MNGLDAAGPRGGRGCELVEPGAAQRQAASPVTAALWASCRLVVPVDAVGVVLLAQAEGREAYASDVAGLLDAHRLATLRLRLDGDTLPFPSTAERSGPGTALASPGQVPGHPPPEGPPDLAARLERVAAAWAQAIGWARAHPSLAGLPIGLFAEGINAAAALQLLSRGACRAGGGSRLAALVSGSGRLDMLAQQSGDSEVATMLLVGADDRQVLAANRLALQRLGCKKRLEVVPGAGPLFDQHGALAVVAELAAGWFTTHLGAARWR